MGQYPVICQNIYACNFVLANTVLYVNDLKVAIEFPKNH